MKISVGKIESSSLTYFRKKIVGSRYEQRAAQAETLWHREWSFRPKQHGIGMAFFYGKIKGGCITMLDVKMIRQNFAEVQNKLATRGVQKVLDRFLTLDERRRELLVKRKNARNCATMFLVRSLP